MPSRRLVAYNTASQSENKIHDDAVARRFGFTGGLVPGVDVYAYLCWAPVAAWGPDWLERGTAEVRFALPTYDGEEVEVDFDEPSGVVDLRNRGGVVVSSGTVILPEVAASPPDPADYPWAPLPTTKPPAAPEQLAAGQLLGSWDTTFRADSLAAYLADVREELDVYADRRIAHPAWVLRQANYILSGNVILGPWMHVGSRVTHHGTVSDGARVSCRGRVAEEYERKGHRFVELDVVVWADDRPVASIDHTAIYLPRQVREG
jgi:hypothetical protein